jgi:hypothetical protein
MKRRAVVKTLSQATMLGMMAAGLYEPLSQAATVNKLGPIGVQLYTLRDDLQQDFEGTLVKVAALGYQEIELVSLPVQPVRSSTAMVCVRLATNINLRNSGMDGSKNWRWPMN